MIRILSTCVDAERGHYVAWLDGEPEVFATSYYGEIDAIGRLVVDGGLEFVCGVTAKTDCFKPVPVVNSPRVKEESVNNASS